MIGWRAPARLLVLTAFAATGCSTPSGNPSFPISTAEAESSLQEMRSTPTRLERPVVLMGGYFDPGLAVSDMQKRLRDAVGDDRIICVSFSGARTFEECRQRVIDAVEAAHPESTLLPDGRRETIDVDVVGNSMGAIVARYAAMWPDPDAEGADARLNVHRLFSIAGPHRGAALANPASASALNAGMAIDSPFVTMLDDALPDAPYELICFVRLGDMIVGVPNSAPYGRTAYWVENLPLQPAHMVAYSDVRFLAEIARQLRGEGSFIVADPAPYPPAPPPREPLVR